MKSQFHKKFFNVDKQVTTVELVRLEQRMNEDLSNYVVRFRISAQKCVESIKEKNLVSVCLNGAQPKYKRHLITKGAKPLLISACSHKILEE